MAKKKATRKQQPKPADTVVPAEAAERVRKRLAQRQAMLGECKSIGPNDVHEILLRSA